MNLFYVARRDIIVQFVLGTLQFGVQKAACRSDQDSFCTNAVPLHRTEAMMHCDLER
jgi:hypothetical protein